MAGPVFVPPAVEVKLMEACLVPDGDPDVLEAIPDQGASLVPSGD